MTTKIEHAIEVTRNMITALSDESRVKARCEELAKDNEGWASLPQIHRSIGEYVKLADEVKDNEFNQLENIGVIRGMLADLRTWVLGRKYSFKDNLKDKIEALASEAYVIERFLENNERESMSDRDISFTYKGSTWTYGELWALEEEDAITNYSEISIAENDTYLHADNIMECIKRHSLSTIEEVLDVLDGLDLDNYDKDDIREFLRDYDCQTIVKCADDFVFYSDRDSFDDNYVDEVVLQGIENEVVKICFDYDAYWQKYARYTYTELSNGTIAYSDF